MTKTGHFCNVEEKSPIALPPKKVDPPIPLPPIALPPYTSYMPDWQADWLQKNVIKSLKLTHLFRNDYHSSRKDNFLKLQSAFGTAGTLWVAKLENG